MTYLQRRVLALVEYVRGNPNLDLLDARDIAEDALDLIARLSKHQKGVLINVCGDLISIFPALKKHFSGPFLALFEKYMDELLLLQVQAERLKREGTIR